MTGRDGGQRPDAGEQSPIDSREVPERRRDDRMRQVVCDRTPGASDQFARAAAEKTVVSDRTVRSRRVQRPVSGRKLGFLPNGYFLSWGYKYMSQPAIWCKEELRKDSRVLLHHFSALHLHSA